MSKTAIPRQQVVEARADLLQNADALRAAQTAPRDPADLADAIRQDLEGFAARSDIRRTAAELAGPKRHGIAALDAHLRADMPVTLADLAAILGPASVAEGVAELIADAVPRGAKPMKDADREAHIRELTAARREIERREELAILAAQDAGETIHRRPDADVELLLEVWR